MAADGLVVNPIRTVPFSMTRMLGSHVFFPMLFLHGFIGKQQPPPISKKLSKRGGSLRYNAQTYRFSFQVSAGHGFV